MLQPKLSVQPSSVSTPHCSNLFSLQATATSTGLFESTTQTRSRKFQTRIVIPFIFESDTNLRVMILPYYQVLTYPYGDIKVLDQIPKPYKPLDEQSFSIMAIVELAGHFSDFLLYDPDINLGLLFSTSSPSSAHFYHGSCALWPFSVQPRLR